MVTRRVRQRVPHSNMACQSHSLKPRATPWKEISRIIFGRMPTLFPVRAVVTIPPNFTRVPGSCEALRPLLHTWLWMEWKRLSMDVLKEAMSRGCCTVDYVEHAFPSRFTRSSNITRLHHRRSSEKGRKSGSSFHLRVGTSARYKFHRR